MNKIEPLPISYAMLVAHELTRDVDRVEFHQTAFGVRVVIPYKPPETAVQRYYEVLVRDLGTKYQRLRMLRGEAQNG